MVFSGRLALEAVSRTPLRAGLTSLGILFGVASVVAMLAIGRGAKQEILDQMRLLGTNNIIITPIVEQTAMNAADEEERGLQPRRVSPGLTVQDIRSIAAMVPAVDAASGEVVVDATIVAGGRGASGKLVGVEGAYFDLVNLPLAEGTGFMPQHVEHGMPVAIIGHGVKTRLFPGEDPVGRRIKAGAVWLTIVGVVGNRSVTAAVAEKLGIRDASMDVYIPVSTMLLRVRDRARISSTDLQPSAFRRGRRSRGLGMSGTPGNNQQEEETLEARHQRLNYHQLDRAIIRVQEAALVPDAADFVRRMLTRRHNQVVDFEVTVPELLLKQEQRARTIFNIVLATIASISLLVGGIGIMNIMLATVLERIREIGVRRAVGARRLDVLSQFLAEAVLISLAGGIAGILLGVGFSLGIERFAEIPTSVSAASVALAFGVSITVGIGFGIVPAWRAAQQDPVVCLRYE